MNSDKTQNSRFKQDVAISTLNGKPLKLLDYFGSNISSTKIDVNLYIEKAWDIIDRLSIIYKIKHKFFLAATVSVWLHHLDLKKCMEKQS